MDITYKLPHPVRIKCTEQSEYDIEVVDRLFNDIFGDVNLENYTSNYLVNSIAKEAPHVYEAYRSANETEHLTGIQLASMLTLFKFRKLSGNILTTSDEIDQRLENTDIGDDIPITYLRPPFSTCYFEFTQSRTSSLKLYNQESGEHILEGVYISEALIEPGTEQMKIFSESPKSIIDTSRPLRVLDLMFTGSPVNKKNALDDALRIQGFFIQDDNLTIKQALDDVIKRFGQDDDFAGDINYLSEALQHIAKVLLFSNCKQYRDTVFNERQEILKKMSSVKSPGKVKKFKNKLRKSYDRIIIKPEDHVVYQIEDSKEHSREHNSKAAHWRKGHFRMQPYGPGASRRKVLFIEPTVVGGIFANKKSYSIKEK